MTERPGPLIIIGGHEDKEHDRLILKLVAERVKDGKLVIATVASHQPEGYFESYQAAFGALGIHNLVELYVNERVETQEAEAKGILEGAAGVFFTAAISSGYRARSATRPWSGWCARSTKGAA